MVEQILQSLNFSSLNEMQLESQRAILKQDTIVLAPTGSGKTLAFLIPLAQMMNRDTKTVQALVIVPSRELALQIGEVFRDMGTDFKVNICYGGHPVKTELNNFQEPPALLIGTPGRIKYHIERDNFKTEGIHTLVLDEFDKSLEFGFTSEMDYIIKHLRNLSRRVLTSASAMDEIPAFTGLQNPVSVNFLKVTSIKPNLSFKKVISKAADKLETLFSLVCLIGNKPTLVFCNHREAVERISEILHEMGIDHDIFHGGMEQVDREKALLKFRNGSYNVLITTDLASRGLDIPEIENIVHYQLPHNEDAYLHRNGRSARMKASGNVFLILTEDENPAYLKEDAQLVELPVTNQLPLPTSWQTIYLAAGKKDKINKIDIVGLLIKKGKLLKEELGRIEVQDYASYVAVKRSKATQVLKSLRDEKIKNKKIKIEISR